MELPSGLDSMSVEIFDRKFDREYLYSLEMKLERREWNRQHEDGSESVVWWPAEGDIFAGDKSMEYMSADDRSCALLINTTGNMRRLVVLSFDPASQKLERWCASQEAVDAKISRLSEKVIIPILDED
ncbi:hypothetical protein BDFG_03090 [Blastomyces dermatitidis ATCC 26199]|nr:hypothetical protein BDFG_03090 [Blastomyces dermatitidis ATCC 26199]